MKYVEFVTRFKAYIHDKPYVTDDVRMMQLEAHLEGDAARLLAGIGGSGLLYPTALKKLKAHFGARSKIARAYISKLTEGGRIDKNDKKSLQDLSFNIIACLSALSRVQHYADANSSIVLRGIVRRLPDFMIEQWKSHAYKLRETNVEPTLSHLSKFVDRAVAKQNDPDFGDLNPVSSAPKTPSKSVKPVVAAKGDAEEKCPLCAGPKHRVSECQAFVAATPAERNKLAERHHLCYGCLYRQIQAVQVQEAMWS